MKSKGLDFPDNFMDIFGFIRADKIVKTVDVGKEFHCRLAHRNEFQGDGEHTAIEFREKFLAEYDNDEIWMEDTPIVAFDFSNVTKISSSFAAEAFAYFLKYASADDVLKTFLFTNINEIHKMIIEYELRN